MIDLKDLPEPFLGRMVVEIIKEDADAYLKKKMQSEVKVSNEFLSKLDLQLRQEEIDPHTGQRKFVAVQRRVPHTKGRIIKIAPDAFGDAFVNKYGNVGYTPELGDIVLFIANESYKIDVEDQYHFVCDCDVVGYHKVTKKEVEHECK